MLMKSTGLTVFSVTAMVYLAACGSKTESASSSSGQPPAAQPASQPATQPASTPAAGSTGAQSPSEPAKATAEPPKPEPPPPPKKYVVAVGTPVTVRTIDSVNTKSTQSGNEFEATLVNPLIVDGHTVAKQGATVVGRVVNADKGGRVKGKASLTLALSRLHLSDGSNVAIQTNSVLQEAKSGTKKNVTRTAIASGAGAAIGAIAGGGRGAAIGAGVGAGAGVATNVATRGPAAEIPPETILQFSLTREFVVMEKR